MKVLITGEIDLAPEARDGALTAAVPFIEAALAEAGCIAYAWSADLSAPGRVHVFEEWASEADLIAHLAGQPYRDMAGHLASVGIKGAVTRKYRVDHTEPVYDPEGRPRGDFFTLKG